MRGRDSFVGHESTPASGPPHAALWTRAESQLRDSVGERNFATWIDPLLVREGADRITLVASDRRALLTLEHHFLGAIRAALRAAGFRGAVYLATAPGDEAAARAPADEIAGLALRPEYTFDEFVVGESNRRAYEAARRIAVGCDGPHRALYLHGGVGVGKTHLAMAVGNAVRARSGEAVALFVSAERLAACWDRSARALERARLLIVDDVQFLAPDVRARAEMLGRIDRLREEGRRVVLTCDLPPHETPELALPILSVNATISPPDEALRREILVHKAARRGLALASDVAAFIAEVAPASVRALEGALNRTLEFAGTLRVPLSVTVAARALDAWRRKPTPQAPPSLEAIADGVAVAFGVPRRQLRQAARRDRETVLARQVAIYLARRLSGRPLAEIAADYGCRDHSVAAHACSAVKSRLAREPALADRVQRVARSLGGDTPMAAVAS